MNRKTLVLGGAAVIGLVIVIGAIFFLIRSGGQEVSTERPVDITLNFFEPWLEAARSAETDPYQEGYAENPLLGKALREQLALARAGASADMDPVLCRTVMPEALTARPISQTDTTAEVLVVSSDKSQPEQSVVTLTSLKDGWYISGIRCTPGEVAPEREFTFDREGNLLKSVPPPLDSTRWHLIFEENGQPGHFAPLFFGAGSMCTSADGVTAACDPNQFIDAMAAHVQGSMTETGVQVKNVILLK